MDLSDKANLVTHSRRGATSVEYLLLVVAIAMICLAGVWGLFSQTSQSLGKLEGRLIPAAASNNNASPSASPESSTPADALSTPPVEAMLFVSALAGVTILFYLAYFHFGWL